jgi:DNA-binding MarR family transcriptional regulator
LVDALAQTAFVTISVLTRVAAEHDLSLTQLRVLAILRDGPRRMNALAEHLGLERSTLTGLVDRAEQRGLLRRRSPAATTDGRAVEVSLTPAGRALARRGGDEVRTALAPVTEHLRADERRQLQRLLEHLLDNGAKTRPTHNPTESP